MKKLTTLLLSLFFYGSLLTSYAQDIALSAMFGGFPYNLSNGQTAPPIGSLPINTSMGALSFTISNTATSGDLILTQSAGKYLQLSGTGVNDFNIDESAITGTLAPGASVSVTVSLKTTVSAGTRTISVSLASNDPDENPFTASLVYTVSVPTMTVTAFSNTLANGGSSTYPIDITNNSTSFDVTIANTASGTGKLDFTQQNCPSACTYFALSGSGASDFTINESTVVDPLNNGSSFTISVTPSNVTSNGSRSVTVTILTNDPTQNTYTHTINYTVNIAALSIQSAKDAGISVFPSPSVDGSLHITAPAFTVNKIELVNTIGVTETVSTLDFQTSLKGIVTVLIHTDKGIFREKVLLQ
ncbi:MAG: choice-of-anchor D domain-containing protein [Cytophagaceae bacterium]